MSTRTRKRDRQLNTYIETVVQQQLAPEQKAKQAQRAKSQAKWAKIAEVREQITHYRRDVVRLAEVREAASKGRQPAIDAAILHLIQRIADAEAFVKRLIARV